MVENEHKVTQNHIKCANASKKLTLIAKALIIKADKSRGKKKKNNEAQKEIIEKLVSKFRKTFEKYDRTQGVFKVRMRPSGTKCSKRPKRSLI